MSVTGREQTDTIAESCAAKVLVGGSGWSVWHGWVMSGSDAFKRNSLPFGPDSLCVSPNFPHHLQHSPFLASLWIKAPLASDLETSASVQFAMS